MINFTREKIIFALVFLIGFTMGIFYFFPGTVITEGLRNSLNDRLPEFVSFQDLKFQSLTTITATVAGEIRNQRVVLPVRANIKPSWSNTTIRIQSPPSTRSTNPIGTVEGEIQTSDNSIRLQADSYPISKVINSQKGVVSGSFKGSFNSKLDGEFEFVISSPKVRELDIFPPVLHGVRIHRFKSEGAIENNKIRFRKMDFVADKVLFDGSMTVTVKRPINQSEVDVDFTVRQPFEREVKDRFTLRELGF